MEVLASGLLLASGRQKSSLRWEALRRIAETPEFFLLQHAGSWYAVPKRAFSDSTQLDWFARMVRERIGGPSGMSGRQSRPHAQNPAARISFPTQYTLADCLDLVLASWLTRGIAILLLGTYVSVMVSVFREDSTSLNLTGMIAGFVPMLLIGGVYVGVSALRLRRAANRQPNGSVSLSDEGVLFADDAESQVRAWETYHYYKETRRNFIIWRRASRDYFIVPKTSVADASCQGWLRLLLEGRLRRSTWFMAA